MFTVPGAGGEKKSSTAESKPVWEEGIESERALEPRLGRQVG